MPSSQKQVRSNGSLVLDTSELESFEIGAKLDALLCYPTWSAHRQQKIADAICTELVSYWIELDASRGAELISRYPRYTRSGNRTALGSLADRREKALTFGLAFLPLLKKAAIGELPILHGAQRELTASEIARFIWPPKEAGDEINYEDRLHDRQRELRSYRPVAHLASAYQYIARERSGPNEAAAFDYQDVDFHRTVVQRVTEFAGFFRAVPALKAISDRLISIEWRE